MSGLEFEKFIASCFKKKGYNLKITKATGDQGADIILEDKKGVLIAVQIKKYVGSVGNKAVQEVVASMKFYDCDKAMVITTGTFTKSAFELASKNGVQLIDKKGLDDLI
ncbi:restriction endonuclease [Candidatus Woesearchaeota archaeon]|nr:restriction endonuclease [Candidatus Woesearchaeota archaeon]